MDSLKFALTMPELPPQFAVARLTKEIIREGINKYREVKHAQHLAKRKEHEENLRK